MNEDAFYGRGSDQFIFVVELTYLTTTSLENHKPIQPENMNTMKTNHEEFVAIFGAEVTELSAKVYSTKSPDELLTSYQGREKELLIYLRKLAFKQQVSGLC